MNIYGVSLAATGGYYYTYVAQKKLVPEWFCYCQARESIFTNQKRLRENNRKPRHGQDFFSSLDYGVGIGYNGKKFFFGGEIKNRWTNEKFNEDQINIQP